jgi:hypothetical protein
MTKVNRAFRLLLVSSMLAVLGAACAADKAVAPEWLLGTWAKTIDEDNGPPDSITFRADGTFATYDDQCKEHTNAYFINNGMVFLVIPLAKGPVALVLQPDSDHSSMKFTSPRTQNNAVYAPSDAPHCRQQS